MTPRSFLRMERRTIATSRKLFDDYSATGSFFRRDHNAGCVGRLRRVRPLAMWSWLDLRGGRLHGRSAPALRDLLPGRMHPGRIFYLSILRHLEQSLAK